MNDDVEKRLAQLTTRGAPPQLRARALAAVAAALAADLTAESTTPMRDDRPSGVPRLARKQCEPPQDTASAEAVAHKRRRVPIGWLVAASLALAAGLNVWVHRSLDHRMAALLGPTPVNQQAALLAADVASVTDRETGQWAYQRLTATPRRPVEPAQYAARLEAALHQFTQDIKEPRHAAPQEDPQVDRHRSGRDDRRALGVERLVRLEHRHAIGEADGRVA